MAGITNKALEVKWKGKDREIKDDGTRGAGRLVARILEGGVFFYFQYFDSAGKHRRLPLGQYGEKPLLTLDAARDKARDCSRLYRDGTRDLHAHFERIRDAEERARRAAEEAARQAQADAKRSTLRQLLDEYSAHLEKAKKQSAADAAGIFKLHVYDAAPDLASKKAAAVTKPEFVDLIRIVVKAGKGRTAAKLRSYLRAAYSLAMQSENDPAAPLVDFGIETNPLASIDAMSKFNRTRVRNLDAEELRAFLKRLESLPQSVKKDALSLCLLLGGPRPAQLLRAKPVNVDLSAGTITLHDSKGRRKEPRAHLLPLTKKAATILRRSLDGLSDNAPVVFTYDGKRGLRGETVAQVVTDISAAMMKAKEAREPFQLRDIRRTCETMLASLGISKDIRAHLLSHGLGGVQNRSYNMHDYALEKRAALEKWNKHLDALAAGKSATVTQAKRAATIAA